MLRLLAAKSATQHIGKFVPLKALPHPEGN